MEDMNINSESIISKIGPTGIATTGILDLKQTELLQNLILNLFYLLTVLFFLNIYYLRV